MKRDLELIRTLLLTIEDFDLPQGTTAFVNTDDKMLQISGYTQHEVAYNLDLLFNAGFVKGRRGPMDFGIAGLTWEGHEVLDDIRDPEIWRKTRERAKSVAGMGLTLPVGDRKSRAKGKAWSSSHCLTPVNQPTVPPTTSATQFRALSRAAAALAFWLGFIYSLNGEYLCKPTTPCSPRPRPRF